MNQLLNECHAALTGRRRGIGQDNSYTRPQRVSQFRGALEEDGEDESLPRGPTEAELDALLRGEEVVEAAPEEVAKKPFNPFLVSH